MNFLTPRTFNLTTAFERLYEAHHRMFQMELDGSIESSEGMDLIVRTSLLHRALTNEFDVTHFSKDEVEAMNRLVVFLDDIVTMVFQGNMDGDDNDALVEDMVEDMDDEDEGMDFSW
jgi:hypothetical protein